MPREEEIMSQLPASLSGRVALVTGGGRGIGRAIALALAEDGADIAVNYRRDEQAARETVAAIEALGRRARSYRASVEDYEADQAMVEGASEDLGPIGILINNAGIASRGRSVADTARRKWSGWFASTPLAPTTCPNWWCRE